MNTGSRITLRVCTKDGVLTASNTNSKSLVTFPLLIVGGRPTKPAYLYAGKRYTKVHTVGRKQCIYCKKNNTYVPLKGLKRVGGTEPGEEPTSCKSLDLPADLAYKIINYGFRSGSHTLRDIFFMFLLFTRGLHPGTLTLENFIQNIQMNNQIFVITHESQTEIYRPESFRNIVNIAKIGAPDDLEDAVRQIIRTNAHQPVNFITFVIVSGDLRKEDYTVISRTYRNPVNTKIQFQSYLVMYDEYKSKCASLLVENTDSEYMLGGSVPFSKAVGNLLAEIPKTWPCASEDDDNGEIEHWAIPLKEGHIEKKFQKLERIAYLPITSTTPDLNIQGQQFGDFLESKMDPEYMLLRLNILHRNVTAIKSKVSEIENLQCFFKKLVDDTLRSNQAENDNSKTAVRFAKFVSRPETTMKNEVRFACLLASELCDVGLCKKNVASNVRDVVKAAIKFRELCEEVEDMYQVVYDVVDASYEEELDF